MSKRVGKAALWTAAGFLLGAAALAGGQGDEDLRNQLIEIESLCGQLRALDAEPAGFPAANEQGFELDCIHVADVTACVFDHYGPRQAAAEGILDGDPEPFQPFGTIEEVSELVRVSVQPDVWEEGAEIFPYASSFVLLAPPHANRAVREFVDRELRPAASRTVNLEVEIVEADEPLGAALAAATGSALDPAARTGLEEAIGAGKARRLFAGTVLALSRQQVVLQHGAQVATIEDPIIGVENHGTVVQARSMVADDPARVRIQLSLDHDLLDRPIRTVKTEKAGTIQMPAHTAMQADADLWAAAGRWTVAAERTGADGKRRLVLVRPTVIGGGR